MKADRRMTVRASFVPSRAAFLVASAGIAACASVAAAQTTYHVSAACGDDTWAGLSAVCTEPDGPKATIQAAIDAAADGDTILVADGVYTGPGNRDMDFAGKAITVRSENGAVSCVIDLQGSSGDPHRAFHFNSGETTESVLEGFTIQNGYMEPRGGAILCEGGSSPVIRGCEFVQNSVEANSFRTGGGAVCILHSDPTFIECGFVENQVTVIDNDVGGGAMYCIGGSPAFTECRFVSNSVVGPSLGSGGGAIAMGDGGAPVFEACTFLNNTTVRDGGAVLVALSMEATFERCVFRGNTAQRNGGAVADIRGGSFVGIGCEFIGNKTDFGAGAAILADSSAASLVNCTFSQNEADTFGGALRAVGGNVSVANCVLWGDLPDEISELIEGQVVVTFSNVEGRGGSDPLFVDPDGGDFSVEAGSLCIDAANNLAVPDGVTVDLAGNPRFHDDPGTTDTGVGGGAGGDMIVDMGAYEFQGSSCAADFNGDGAVDTRDVLAFLNAWSAQDASSDCDRNGVIDTRDVLCFLNTWSAGC
jgi:predicted outer membrane repeat protein